MKRGEIWTIAGGGDFTGKARPVVIVQDDRFGGSDSVTVCACTSDPSDLPLFRITVQPNEQNGLASVTRVMADKIITVYRRRLGTRIGSLDAEDMSALGKAILVYLGFGTTAGAQSQTPEPEA